MKEKLTSSTLPLLALFLVLAPTALASTTWYVDGVHGSDNQNCISSQTACKTIRHAISLAASGDSVRVAAATYGEHLTIPPSLNLTIIGSGATTTIIDGFGFGRLVVVPANSRVIISGVTIRNGHAQYGAGIVNFGVFTVFRSILVGNVAYDRCSDHCGPYSGRGGAVLNSGKMIISNSTITQNVAKTCTGIVHLHCSGLGGGIWNAGTLTINDDTLSANSVDLGVGGGVFNDLGILTVNNSTVSMNSRGGLYNLGGTLTANNSTVSDNGGGIFNEGKQGTATLQNSIVANNSGGNCSGTMTSKGYNLSSDGTCNFSSSGDRNNVNPKLGTLGDYGGPTQTIPLLSGSPAIDAGNPSGCTDGQGHLLTTDQRGQPRPDKEDRGGCDMGAYESQTD